MPLSSKEYKIECFTQQKGNMFEVKWQGYDYTKNTWESRETVQQWEGFYEFIIEREKENNKADPKKTVIATIFD